MNKRSKNKNKPNKPPNPTPPQKMESPIEDNISSEPKIESRVPEIVPEAVPQITPAEMKIESELEIPRKPKRNKSGKNKTLEKEDNVKDLIVSEIKADINPPIVIKEKTDNIATIKKTTNEIPINEEQIESILITPTARKKKGKNKNNDLNIQGENSQKSDVSQQIMNTNQTQITKNADNINKPNNETNINIEISDQDIIVSKKKNKKKNKKNRKDSEISETNITTEKEISHEEVPRELKDTEIKSNLDIMSIQNNNKDMNITVDSKQIETTIKTKEVIDKKDIIELKDKEIIIGNVNKQTNKKNKKSETIIDSERIGTDKKVIPQLKDNETKSSTDMTIKHEQIKTQNVVEEQTANNEQKPTLKYSEIKENENIKNKSKNKKNISDSGKSKNLVDLKSEEREIKLNKLENNPELVLETVKPIKDKMEVAKETVDLCSDLKITQEGEKIKSLSTKMEELHNEDTQKDKKKNKKEKNQPLVSKDKLEVKKFTVDIAENKLDEEISNATQETKKNEETKELINNEYKADNTLIQSSENVKETPNKKYQINEIVEIKDKSNKKNNHKIKENDSKKDKLLKMTDTKTVIQKTDILPKFNEPDVGKGKYNKKEDVTEKKIVSSEPDVEKGKDNKQKDVKEKDLVSSEPDLGKVKDNKQEEVKEKDLVSSEPDAKKGKYNKQKDVKNKDLVLPELNVGKVKDNKQEDLKEKDLVSSEPDVGKVKHNKQEDVNEKKLVSSEPDVGKGKDNKQKDVKEKDLVSSEPDVGKVKDNKQEEVKKKDLVSSEPDVKKGKDNKQKDVKNKEFVLPELNVGKVKDNKQEDVKEKDLVSSKPDVGKGKDNKQEEVKEKDLISSEPDVGKDNIQEEVKENNLVLSKPNVRKGKNYKQDDVREKCLVSSEPGVGKEKVNKQDNIKEKDLVSSESDVGKGKDNKHKDVQEKYLVSSEPDVEKENNNMQDDVKEKDLLSSDFDIIDKEVEFSGSETLTKLEHNKENQDWKDEILESIAIKEEFDIIDELTDLSQMEIKGELGIGETKDYKSFNILETMEMKEDFDIIDKLPVNTELEYKEKLYKEEEKNINILESLKIKDKKSDKLEEQKIEHRDPIEINSESLEGKTEMSDQLPEFSKQCKKKGYNKKNTEKGNKRNKTPSTLTINVESEETASQFDSKLIASKFELNLKLLSPSDIELQNMKLDDVDVMPDSIEHPRAVSEQMFIDSNNNMVISQINTAEPQNLSVANVIPDTPFTLSSGESLDISSATGKTDVKVNKLDTPIKSFGNMFSEKTDLKSKVMEVNQDMEELRLSLEKSLAELTAMEKSDEMPELVTITQPVGQVDLEFIYQDKADKEMKHSLKLEEIQDVSTQEIDNKNTQITTDTVKLSDIGVNVIATSQEPSSQMIKKDKGKGKSKKRPKSDTEHPQTSTTTTPSNVDTSTTKSEMTDKSNEEEIKRDSQKPNESEKVKQQADTIEDITYDKKSNETDNVSQNFDPIESFEDAITSSVNDVNKSFEVIASELNIADNVQRIGIPIENPEISITPPQTDKEKEKSNENPVVSHPKNLLGHPDFPVQSSRTDYKKEKNKTPNTKQARVKIKDGSEIETEDKTLKQSRQSQTDNNSRIIKNKKNITHSPYDNEDYIYKYSFRKVFLPNACLLCKKILKDARVPCNFCNAIFYCSDKHKDDDWSQHQSLCFAISTVVHLKGLNYLYADAKNVTGQNYRLLRMQMIVSCEKILKRRLVPWEQEILLYPRMCADVSCREWRQSNLKDCEGCGQVSYCKDHPEHFPKDHQRWCKSYSLYQSLVIYQQTKGRLEPKLPTKVMNVPDFELPEKINELLATMYEEKIDMDELQYAALTQLATAPLTAAYCHQVYNNKINITHSNGVNKKSTFTLHVVGAELQFEADALYKWEIFFLHLKPDVKELRVVLVGPELNPSNLPLDILAKIKLCESCSQSKRKVTFSFHDKELYHEFTCSDDFTLPDLVCAFNSSVNRGIGYKGIDSWPATINSILKLRSPFCITSYTPNELPKDLIRIKECSNVNFKVVTEPSNNPYASFRPDRNFISDDEMPLLFKNYCYMIICGTF